MLRHTVHDNATSNVLAWSSHAANVESAAEEEAGADADEPPDSGTISKTSPEFKRTNVSKPKESNASLLTRALQVASDAETNDSATVANRISRRRRSITSDISLASTADLTSDTGPSTPARTNTPSPRLPDLGFSPIALDKHLGSFGLRIVGSLPRTTPVENQASSNHVPAGSTSTEAPKTPVVQAIEKKRCISFACTAKPKDDAPNAQAQNPSATTTTQPVHPVQPRKPCIKFACPARPNTQHTPPQRERLVIPKTEESGSVSTVVNDTPSTVRKARSPVAPRRSRPGTPRKSGQSPVAIRKKRYITANTSELQNELCHFHEFASDHPREEDWIRQEKTVAKKKLTIDDLLKKENDIRRIGKEAEEEAEIEEEDAEGGDEENADVDDGGIAEDEDEDDEEIEEEEDIEDDESGYGSDDDFSDGYNTDEDYGFAESDDDEDDGLVLWTFGTQQSAQESFGDAAQAFQPSSLGAHLSDSSAFSKQLNRSKVSHRQIAPRAITPELPDSTDFVCGTMDEDRPLEEAYLTRLAARKQEKLRVIPQDIDPSFPTSEPEDDEDENVKHSHDSDHLWLHGELEELHDEARPGRRRKTEGPSPKRLRSPPPKRYYSPPPKARGRSPRRLFDRSSPKRVKSPAPVHHPKSPMVSPTHTAKAIGFEPLAARPGLTHTKSLPRGAYFPGHLKSGKRTRVNTVTKHENAHVRGAIDIVKGLEQKRQRRKEKFHQKYCNRARKGQIPEKRAMPGEGAERMRELGLLLAGKLGQGNYVISI